ncbi:MAG TPA: hypothetical protein EYG02_00700 [Henriciella marina]|uniref:hypothetical protein n=1 Tax=Henriciella sp. TaxID=1968823 RepID=UPI00178E28D0|nr:hypothetical protein [Henriciella sp.]HIG23996.1 hypothetical protein [Henriciella sp.]HIK63530.1 hypothetical protein [Henriciella marina]
MSNARSSLTGPANGYRFSRQQLIRIVVVGLSVWLAGALLLRWLGPMGVYDGSARIVLYALIIPGTLPIILLLPVLAGIKRSQIAAAAAFATATAILMDGLALAWFSGLYGETIAQHAGAGAAILWGGAVAIFLGFFLNRDQ